MSIRQITIIGTGLIGGSLGLALHKYGFRGTVVGCDRKGVVARAKRKGAVDQAFEDPIAAVRDSEVIVLATPVGGILDLTERLAFHLAPHTLLTDVGSTKGAIVARTRKIFGNEAGARFLPGHPMAGKENSGIDHADADLFCGAMWFVTPGTETDLRRGHAPEYLRWIKKIGAKVAAMQADEHDELCAWISHVPQMIATALASLLVEQYGSESSLLDAGGRALREMTRIAASPYSMWRDIAITNKEQISDALLKLEQRLAHLRENLDTRQLEAEFEKAHRLKTRSTLGHRDTGKRQK